MAENIDLKFTPIRVSTLRGDKNIPFNAYVKVGERHILYCRKGDSFEGDRLNRLKSKKLKRLYILEKDSSKFKGYLDANIDEAFDLSHEKDLLTRMQVIQGHQQAVAEDIMENPDVETHYQVGVQSCERFIDLLNKEALALKVLYSVSNDDFSISHHGVNVSTLSVLLAKLMGVLDESLKKTTLLALGALIHDYGHQFISVDLSKSRAELSKDELKIYKVHPTEGINQIRALNHFETIVINIIHEHEEFIDGSGFPQGLYERDIDPMALIVGTANTFDRLVSFEKKSPEAALKHMIIDRMGQHPLDIMKGLQVVLKNCGIIK